MNHSKNTAINIYLIYLSSATGAALLNAAFPSESESILKIFLPEKLGGDIPPFVRYRFILFLASTAALIGAFLSHFFSKPSDFQLYSITRLSWGWIAFSICFVPIGWVFYPALALCVDCITANDTAYFFLTVCFFVTLHVFLQVIFLKFNHLRTNK